MADSSGVAFVEPTADDNQRLVLADLRKRTIDPLTSPSEKIQEFDIRDGHHYIYAVVDRTGWKKMREERQAPWSVGAERSLNELLFPDDPRFFPSRNYLLAVVGAKHFQVKQDGLPIRPKGGLALSPDGQSLVTTLTVPEVPPSWETVYPPSHASSPYRIRAGRDSVHQYVRISLQTGAVQSLTDAPTSNDAGWWAVGSPSWSSDSQEILLPGTFIESKDHAPSRPCVAVVDVSSDTCTCVETLKGHTETGVEEGYHLIWGARFTDGDKQRVIVSFIDHQDDSYRTTEYRRTADRTWQVVGQFKEEPKIGQNRLEVTVKEKLNEPPRLVATNKQTSRVIWDPNSQLKHIDLGQASAYKWKDKTGRDWRGGLFTPSNYTPGQRFPLVIQTHGFTESEFKPSGLFPTAFAARALAAAGIVVVQVNEDQCVMVNRDEGPCAVSGYESVARQLVSEGLVDPDRIGIIGFSRTCFDVMETLTAGSLQVAAASITDGFMVDYFQYILDPERNAPEANSMIGAPPFGEGLQEWLKRSPGFNLDKVSTPLLINAGGPPNVLSMWQPYAVLHHLHKPVDLIMLNTDEHVLTNPAVRMASQGGSVDWFRFWLKGEEDPDPAKAAQYARWRELRKMQEQNEAKPQAAPAN